MSVDCSVLGGGEHNKVGSAVVEGIVVYVVNLDVSGSVEDIAVHFDVMSCAVAGDFAAGVNDVGGLLQEPPMLY